MPFLLLNYIPVYLASYQAVLKIMELGIIREPGIFGKNWGYAKWRQNA